MRKKGFTLIELLVVVAIIAMLLAILMPALSRVKKIAQRVVCGTNLKGLGTSQVVYSQDFNDDMAVLDAAVSSGTGSSNVSTVTWSSSGTVGWNDPAKSRFSGPVTVGASLYLLVKYADTNPKQFVCPASDQIAYGGENTGPPNSSSNAALDIVELNDFGKYGTGNPGKNKQDDGDNSRHGPKIHVSYAYHQPYTKHSADSSKSAQFAVMADKNPWMDNKLEPLALGKINGDTYMDSVCMIGLWWESDPPREWKLGANSQPHEREGQNVAYGDGHNEYTKTSDVGVKFDNIYTVQVKPTTDDDRDHRRGVPGDSLVTGKDSIPQNIVGNSTTNDLCPRTSWDSILVNDDVNGSKNYL